MPCTKPALTLVTLVCVPHRRRPPGTSRRASKAKTRLMALLHSFATKAGLLIPGALTSRMTSLMKIARRPKSRYASVFEPGRPTVLGIWGSGRIYFRRFCSD